MKASVLAIAIVGASTGAALAQPDLDALVPEHECLASDPVDDLAKASDATADVATIPTPRLPEAPAPVAASADDVDLGSLGLDPDGSPFDDKLNLYGFADVGYTAIHWLRDPMFFPQNSSTFGVGNVNVYLAKNVTRRARALIEVRFTFLPNGTRNADGSYLDTAADDSTNEGRTTQWGGIVIERAYVEYDLGEHLTIRAGRWLTPYGIWNIDHGSPAIVGISRPHVVGEQLFPEHQTGLDLFGSQYHDGFKVTYHATASNGRGATEAVADLDTGLALGGRLELETPWGLKVGASHYRGRYTGLPTMAGAAAETYLEASYGSDAQLDAGALHLQGELIAQERHYEAGRRAALAGAFVPDSRALGGYGLAGYRLDRLWSVMPFGILEMNRSIDSPVASGGQTIGLNFRPSGALVLKLQGTRVWIGDGAPFLGGHRFYLFGAQASWMF